jgi:hypothetical protein
MHCRFWCQALNYLRGNRRLSPHTDTPIAGLWGTLAHAAGAGPGVCGNPTRPGVAQWRHVLTSLKTIAYFCREDALANCRRVSQTRIAPKISAHVPGHAVNINSLNKLHKLAWELHYVPRGTASPASPKSKPVESRGRKTSGLKAPRVHDSGVAGAATCLVS